MDEFRRARKSIKSPVDENKKVFVLIFNDFLLCLDDLCALTNVTIEKERNDFENYKMCEKCLGNFVEICIVIQLEWQ